MQKQVGKNAHQDPNTNDQFRQDQRKARSRFRYFA